MFKVNTLHAVASQHTPTPLLSLHMLKYWVSIISFPILLNIEPWPLHKLYIFSAYTETLTAAYEWDYFCPISIYCLHTVMSFCVLLDYNTTVVTQTNWRLARCNWEHLDLILVFFSPTIMKALTSYLAICSADRLEKKKKKNSWGKHPSLTVGGDDMHNRCGKKN